MQKPTIHSIEIVHQNPWSLVRHHSLTWPNGKPGDYYVFELPEAACVICIKDNQIMTVKQYRLPIDEDSIELPMGRVESGETPEQAAKRELAEESGLKALNLRKLGIAHPANGAVKMTMHIYVCTQFEQTNQHLDIGEVGLEKNWMPIQAWKELIKTNQITDGDTLTAWALYLSQNT